MGFSVLASGELSVLGGCSSTCSCFARSEGQVRPRLSRRCSLLHGGGPGMQPRCHKALQVCKCRSSAAASPRLKAYSLRGKVVPLGPPFAWWHSSERDGGRTCSPQRLGEPLKASAAEGSRGSPKLRVPHFGSFAKAWAGWQPPPQCLRAELLPSRPDSFL